MFKIRLIDINYDPARCVRFTKGSPLSAVTTLHHGAMKTILVDLVSTLVESGNILWTVSHHISLFISILYTHITLIILTLHEDCVYTPVHWIISWLHFCCVGVKAISHCPRPLWPQENLYFFWSDKMSLVCAGERRSWKSQLIMSKSAENFHPIIIIP